jgi:periplasmic divalent cation tolerance protein
LSSKKQPYLLLSTVASRTEAQKIADALVQKRLCACVNIVPSVSSVFSWKNKVDRAKELLLVIKTNQGRLKEIERTIRKHHSYTVPEIIGWPIAWGHKPYLGWIKDSLK